jgi:HlyD family secretion protein
VPRPERRVSHAASWMSSDLVANTQRSIRHQLLAGVAIAILLVGGVGGWAGTTEIAGAVIASGQLVVDSYVKKVQHPTGGIVGEIRVVDGDRVKSGDIVLRLDETQTRANLQVILNQIDELMARQARNEAERDGADKLQFPHELLSRIEQPEVARVVHGEEKLFEVRATAREGQKAQFRERIAQLKEQIQGLNEQVVAKAKEIDWIHLELTGVRDLWRKNLIQFTRVTSLERDAARLEGDRGNLIASIAQTKGKITETELQILQVDQDLRTDVGKELAEIRGKMSELAEKRVTAEDQLKRIALRAPQDGKVHQLSVHTVGGVIQAGEQIMLIVPEDDSLKVEVKIQPYNIDQLAIGQKAVLRFTAFNQRTTPELNGIVTLISADITMDEKASASYYTVRITVPESEIARLRGLKLVAGMPVEAFIQTKERTVISYLVKPLQDQILKAFREK